MKTMEKITQNYANKLLYNHNLAPDKTQKNLLTVDDYLEILKPVTKIITDNKDASLEELRNLIYVNSEVENILKKSVYERKMVPGAVISYGTNNFHETISIGKTSDFGNGIITDENTIYDLASVTKIFTSISIQLLSARGMLDLSKPVTYYLPEFLGLSNVTIYQLLTFNAFLKTDGRVDKANDKNEAETILKTIAIDNLNNGKRPYTDMGAMVLKYVVEKTSGINFFDFVNKNILEISKMYNTYVSVPDEKILHLAETGYDGFYYKDGNYRINEDVRIGDCYDAKARIMGQRSGNLSGHAGLFSTGNDMSNLALSLMNCNLLSEDEVLSMADNETGNADLGIQYLGKLCYSKNPSQEDSEIYHPLSGKTIASAGWTGTQLTVDPVNKVFYSLLSNRSNNRMTFIDADKKSLVYQGEHGEKLIDLPNGTTMIDATRYAWDRDAALVHPVIKLAIQNKFLEYIFESGGEKLVKTYKVSHI